MASESAQQIKKKANTLQKGRYGSNLLYSSSDEEDVEPSATNLPPPVHSSQASSVEASSRRHGRSRSSDNVNNPFENFTVKQKSNMVRSQTIRTSEVSGHQSKSRLPLSSTVAISGSKSSRFNPLGQVEGCMPALIPENEEEGGGEWHGYSLGVDDMEDCPIIDDWLIDDMSVLEQTRPNKGKKQLSSSYGSSRKEIRSFLEGTSSNSTSASGGGRRKRPLQRKDKTTSQERLSSRFEAVDEITYQQSVSDEQTSKRRRMDSMVVSSSNSDERFLDSIIITEEDLMDFDTTSVSNCDLQHPSRGNSDKASRGNLDAPHSSSSGNPTRHSSKQQPAPSHHSVSGGHLTSRTHSNSTSAISFSQCHGPSPSNTLTTTTNSAFSNNIALYSDLPPLRVRVKIECKSYLIPCPRKGADGLDTTVGWLITQASERHHAQEGVRPKLSLTTLDGALLCPSDPLIHVLSPNEEVVGVVKGWQEATLEESYQAACKNAGVGESDP